MDVTPGIVFADGIGNPNNHTDTNLEQYVNAATFSKMLLSDFASSQRPLSKGGAFPSSPSAGDGFILTTPTDYFACFYYNGSGWVEILSGVSLTNRSGSAVSYGQIVAIDTVNSQSFAYPSSSDNTLILGVAGASVSNLDLCPVITWGPVILYELDGGAVNGGAIINSSSLYSAKASSIITGGNSTCLGRLIDKTLKIAFIDVMVS